MSDHLRDYWPARWHLTLRLLPPTTLLVLLAASAARAEGPGIGHDLRRLVFVTEDVNMDAKGCDAVSVFDLDQDEAVHHGRHFTSPGRLTATSDFTTVLAGISMRMPNPRRAEEDPFILWERYKPDREIWETVGLVMGDAFAAVGGLGLLADDDTQYFRIWQPRGWYRHKRALTAYWS